MTAALSPRGLAAPALPAPFLALSRPRPTRPVRRSLTGVGIAVLCHGALLAAIIGAVGEERPPVVPPQPYMTVSLLTPPGPTPEPPRPQAPPQQPKEARPTPQPQAAPPPSDPPPPSCHTRCAAFVQFNMPDITTACFFKESRALKR